MRALAPLLASPLRGHQTHSRMRRLLQRRRHLERGAPPARLEAPLQLRRPLYRWTNNDPNYIESILWLRWPWIHRSGMIRHVGNCEDRTIERLAGITNLEDYEKKNRGLRGFIGILVRLPFFGALMAPILRNFVMLDTVSIKPTGPGG